MTNALDRVSDGLRETLVAELRQVKPDLLDALLAAEEPTNDQRSEVVQSLTAVLMDEFGPDWVPTERGREIERAIGAFLQVWPPNQ